MKKEYRLVKRPTINELLYELKADKDDLPLVLILHPAHRPKGKKVQLKFKVTSIRCDKKPDQLWFVDGYSPRGRKIPLTVHAVISFEKRRHNPKDSLVTIR